MSDDSEKTIIWVILFAVGAVLLSILAAAFVSAVGALGYFLTHGGAALAVIVIGYFIWRSRR